LVVVAIIGILVSILLPSLKRARYMATLAVCASNQSQIARGATIYTVSNDRLWPRRDGNYDGTAARGYPTPATIYSSQSASNTWDDRPRLAPYIALDDLHCPFIDSFEIVDRPAMGGLIVFSYSMYFGWKLTSSDNGKRMKRIGDNMMQDGVPLGAQAGTEFDILVADIDIVYGDRPSASTGHSGTGLTLLTTEDPNALSRYTGETRGDVDLNYARTDGSVFGVKKVQMRDSRMSRVEYKDRNHGSQLSDKWTNLPKVDD
jgi:hypothetical protein